MITHAPDFKIFWSRQVAQTVAHERLSNVQPPWRRSSCLSKESLSIRRVQDPKVDISVWNVKQHTISDISVFLCWLHWFVKRWPCFHIDLCLPRLLLEYPMFLFRPPFGKTVHMSRLLSLSKDCPCGHLRVPRQERQGSELEFTKKQLECSNARVQDAKHFVAGQLWWLFNCWVLEPLGSLNPNWKQVKQIQNTSRSWWKMLGHVNKKINCKQL